MARWVSVVSEEVKRKRKRSAWGSNPESSANGEVVTRCLTIGPTDRMYALLMTDDDVVVKTSCVYACE